MPINLYCNDIITYVVAKLAKLWKKSTVKEIPTTAYYLPDDETQMATFTQKYDEVQKQLQTIAAMDNLLSGTMVFSNAHMYKEHQQ